MSFHLQHFLLQANTALHSMGSRACFQHITLDNHTPDAFGIVATGTGGVPQKQTLSRTIKREHNAIWRNAEVRVG